MEKAFEFDKGKSQIDKLAYMANQIKRARIYTLGERCFKLGLSDFGKALADRGELPYKLVVHPKIFENILMVFGDFIPQIVSHSMLPENQLVAFWQDDDKLDLYAKAEFKEFKPKDQWLRPNG